MFFGSGTKKINFTVADIEEYKRSLQDAVDAAYEQYRESNDWARKIIEGLGELIAFGNQNLEVCRSQLEACENNIQELERVINELLDVVSKIDSALYQLDQDISSADAVYQKAVSKAEKARNMPEGETSQEQFARSMAISAAERQLSSAASDLSSLRDKRSRLYNGKCDVEADMSSLQAVLKEFQAIQQRLTQEEQRISYAISDAESLEEDVRRSLERLNKSFRNDIEVSLGECQKVTNTALKRARAALICMGELNGKSYTDYDPIEITDLDAFQKSSGEMANRIDQIFRTFGQLYQIRDSHSAVITDDILTASDALYESVANVEQRTIEQMKRYSKRLDEFGNSLQRYYQTKM